MNSKIEMKLLKRLPKKYHNRVSKIEQEDGLIDDCKYMLYYTEEFTDGDGGCCGGCYPFKSISEAIDFIKNDLYKVNDLN